MNIIDTILQTSPMQLRIVLVGKNNRELLGRFKADFISMSTYKPETKDDKLQVLEYSKAFIDEFKNRIIHSSNGGVLEFSNLMQDMMKSDRIGGDSYYTRNLIRLYSYCIKLMELRGMPYKQLKKEFL